MSEAGLLKTSGLVMTKRMFLDLRMVMRVTPWICLKPSLDMAWEGFFFFWGHTLGINPTDPTGACGVEPGGLQPPLMG